MIKRAGAIARAGGRACARAAAAATGAAPRREAGTETANQKLYNVRASTTSSFVAATAFVEGSADGTRFPVTNRAFFENAKITEELGVVVGNSMRTVNILADLSSALGGVLGGGNRYYTNLMTETTASALDDMVTYAKAVGADGIVNVRFSVMGTMNRLILGLHTGVLVQGTAVRLDAADAAVAPVVLPATTGVEMVGGEGARGDAGAARAGEAPAGRV